MREKGGNNPPTLPRILGISESDRQPLHTPPRWFPPHSGGNPLLSQVVEALSPHPSSSSDLSPLPSLNLGFPDHYCPRTFVAAMPSDDSLAQCKNMSSERPFLLTLFSLPWNYPDGIGHKAQEDKNFVLVLVVPQLPVQGLPSIQWMQNVKGEHWLDLLWQSLALVCVTGVPYSLPPTPAPACPLPATPFLTSPCP